ncbi:cytosolic endo-beta-N-acetylglucosaminidase [Athalia rosae]|uniref:cytosolic endo-beta-N-acetylglucosaminidase n=1 Tax=Athalia rosae TaxID=37344 RepID=UPI002033F8F8|nr:cytosolic endo-beta-N-acetylglucosaminidase [Athalia rosae]
MSSTVEKGADIDEALTSKPFKTLKELYDGVDNLPEWPKIQELRKSTDYVYSGKNINNVKLPLEKFPRNEKPKTLVCHDMKGGYLDDRFVNGSKAHDSYVFYHWSVIDTFIYFSHYFVTVPPHGWINAAHIHGVKILGTIITEWTDGAKIWDEIFKSEDEVKKFADALIAVAKFYKFDGYLLNVENKIDKKDVDKLIFFVKYLTDNIHKELEDSEIIWYDSVTCTGSLTWQNQLNDSNKCFFNVCDGIFLNYNWSDKSLKESCEKAISENRNVRDIYVGLDVWGRGCPGGGGFNSDYALRKIREHDMSVAIFAPGWTHEHFGPKTFVDTENVFWAQLVPYLYIHVPLFNGEIFQTSFCHGAGLNQYNQGRPKCEDYTAEDWFNKDTPFFNLSAQCHQLSVPAPELEFFKEPEAITSSCNIDSNLLNKNETTVEKVEPEKKLAKFETKRNIVRVEGSTICFDVKDNICNINYFQSCTQCSYNGGRCLELITQNCELYHRLFLIEATFPHEIQVSLVYRIDIRIPELTEPLLVIGNDENLKLVKKYKTEELHFPWKRNIYLTGFKGITQIGVAASQKGITTLGEIIIEQKQPGYRDLEEFTALISDINC